MHSSGCECLALKSGTSVAVPFLHIETETHAVILKSDMAVGPWPVPKTRGTRVSFGPSYFGELCPCLDAVSSFDEDKGDARRLQDVWGWG